MSTVCVLGAAQIFFAWGALTYSLDEGQMSGRAEALLPSNLPDVLRVAALSGRLMGVCLCEAR
jgi:hypothetical protein